MSRPKIRHLDRFDLTGRSIKKWRVPLVVEFKAKCKALFDRLHAASKKTPPGADHSVKDQAKTTPGKLLNLADAKLEEIPLENQLRIAETEKAFNEAELARARIRRERIETAHRQLDLIERLRELTDGKPLPRIVDQDGNEVIVVADIVGLLEEARSKETTE